MVSKYSIIRLKCPLSKGQSPFASAAVREMLAPG